MVPWIYHVPAVYPLNRGSGVSYHAADMLGAVTAGRYTGRYDILCALVSARMRNATRMGIRAEDPSSFSRILLLISRIPEWVWIAGVLVFHRKMVSGIPSCRIDLPGGEVRIFPGEAACE